MDIADYILYCLVLASLISRLQLKLSNNAHVFWFFVQFDARNANTGEVIFKDSIGSIIAGMVKVCRIFYVCNNYAQTVVVRLAEVKGASVESLATGGCKSREQFRCFKPHQISVFLP